MTADRTLERTHPDWSLYVSDFPARPGYGDSFVTASLHVRGTARLKVEQLAEKDARGPQIVVSFGPYCQVFIPRHMAYELCGALMDLFSTGAIAVASLPPASVSDALLHTLTAPAEPTKDDES